MSCSLTKSDNPMVNYSAKPISFFAAIAFSLHHILTSGMVYQKWTYGEEAFIAQHLTVLDKGV